MDDHGSVRSPRLREHRQRLALTQQEVATRIEQLAWAHERRHAGVNADMVSKWERGLKHPSPFYVRLLCGLFGTTPNDLGFRVHAKQPESSEAVAPDADDSDDLLGSLAVLEGSLVPPSLLVPRVVELWRRDVLSRRQTLAIAGADPLALKLGTDRQLLGVHETHVAVDAQTLDQLDRASAHLEASYYSVESQSLLMPARALSDTVEGFLADVSSRRVRGRLLTTLARANLLAGRVMFFDLNRPFEARSHLDLAREAAEQAANPALVATVLGHMAFLPAATRNFAGAEAYLAAAWKTDPSPRSHVVGSWLQAVASEFHSNAGNSRMALGSIDR
ncbi:MAG: hypothetical protein JWR52_1606, partial [Marmoricola sp.]|nr:hypothetical protein [Marmoricola sp.]